MGKCPEIFGRRWKKQHRRFHNDVDAKTAEQPCESVGMTVTGKLMYDFPRIDIGTLESMLPHVDFSLETPNQQTLLDVAWRWREEKPDHFKEIATWKLLYDIKNTPLDVVEKLLPFIDINACEDENRNSVLHQAVEKSASCVEAVLKFKPQIDATNAIHETPLVRAVWGSKLQSARLLLHAKADINVAYKGIGIAHVAATSPDATILEFLKIYSGLSFNQRDLHGRTPLHYVAMYAKPQRPRVVHLAWLVREGLDPMDADTRGEIPLHHAVRSGSTKTAKRLLELGSVRQLKQRNLNGKRPIDLTTKGTKMYKMLRNLERRTGGFWTWFDFHTGNRFRLPSPRRTGLYIRIYVTIACTLVGLHFYFFVRQWNNGVGVGMTIAIGCLLALYLLVSMTSPGLVKHSKHPPTTIRSGQPALSSHPNANDIQSLLWVRDGRSICVTCRHIRPLRSKHCSTLDECVMRYDHYCPFLANTIGAKNYRYYLLFLLYAIGVLSTVIFYDAEYLLLYGTPGGRVVSVLVLLQAFPLFLWVCMLFSSHVYLISANLTTNEYVNWMRYKYLITEKKHFKNDFDLGLLCNFWNGLCETDHMIPPRWLPNEAEYREFWPNDVEGIDGPCPVCGCILLAPDQDNGRSACSLCGCLK